jgi:hypothetical protein
MFYEQYRQTAINYFKAKQQFISDQIENQVQLTTMEYEELAEKYTMEDKYMQHKLDYMYNFMDYDNDRLKVRQKFLDQMNKRVDLRDIGEMLDELVIENKAKHYKHYDLREHYAQQPKRPTQDFTSNDFKWSGRLLKLIDAKAPYFIDNPDLINQADPNHQRKFQHMYDVVKHNDNVRDYSETSLTP